MSADHKLLHEKVTHAILGGFYDVYNQLGPGFLESVYESAMEIELREAGLMVTRQCEAPVYFKGHLIGKFVIDLVVENKVIVELKASRALAQIHEAQVINLLKATRYEVGLLLNFGHKPEFKRLVYSSSSKPLKIASS